MLRSEINLQSQGANKVTATQIVLCVKSVMGATGTYLVNPLNISELNTGLFCTAQYKMDIVNIPQIHQIYIDKYSFQPGDYVSY